MSEKKYSKRKLAITCGGTGGHFYPGLSIARTFKDNGGEVILFLSGKHTRSQSETAKLYGIDSVIVRSSPRPHNPIQAVKFIADLLNGIWASRKAMKEFKPEALLAMGSFASVSSGFAALSMKIPLYLHDGNARIGKANRFLSRFAKHIGTAFPAVNADTVKCSYSCTGMPVRPELISDSYSKQEAIQKLNSLYSTTLEEDIPTLLIFGGSQGALVFNQTLPEALFNLDNPKLQVIHLSGAGKLEEMKELYSKASFKTLLLESSKEMDLIYSASDVAVCRSGGSTIAELELFGKYALLVPYPFAAEGHQTDNAEFHCSSGAGKLIPNEECCVENISNFLKEWLANPEELANNGKKGLSLAKPEAAHTTLDLIFSK